MPSFSRFEPGSPPNLEMPRDYNAAVDFIDRHLAEGRSNKIAVRDDRGAYSYAQLNERVNRAGNALRWLGVEPEHRVAICMQDTIDFPSLFWGAIKAGVVPVLLNTLLSESDYEYLLRDSRARALVVSDALLPKLSKAIASAHDARSLKHVIVASTPAGGDAGKYARLDDLLPQASASLVPAPTCADDVAFWLYSSGSTGAPKGVLHLHSNLAWTAKLYGQGVLGIREDDVIFSTAKLFFAYGLGNGMTFPLSVGATAVLMAERPTPQSVMRTLRTHQPTLFGAVPTLFASMLSDVSCTRESGSTALRVSISAGEPLPKHVGEKWRERFGSDILDGIGSTEMLHIFLSNRHGQVRYGTTGQVVPGYELKLLDDTGEPVKDGEEGLLWVKGPSQPLSYWNNRERSQSTFHGEWTRTGDRYVRDADGYYTYSGRADDMLKVSGIWVSPFEVEQAVASHPSVLEAAVVGYADADKLIKPKAFVVLKRAEDASDALVAELQAHVKGQLAPYKYPRWIEFVRELPKTATGKIQRFKLRA